MNICTDCKHHAVKGWQTTSESASDIYCTHSAAANVVTGEHLRRAADMRMPKGPCGPEGRLWEHSFTIDPKEVEEKPSFLP